MLFTLSPAILTRFPALSIGLIVATEIENTTPSHELTALLRTEEANVRATMNLETYRDHPLLAAMQEVHRSFGNNPNKNQPSIQALLKRVLKGSDLPTISPLVDCYNVISLRHKICVGAEDLDKMSGNLVLAYADGTEQFRALGEEGDEPPEAGELVYKDDHGAICRKLNWREGERTKITEKTTRAAVVVEGFPPLTRQELEQALKELSDLLQKFCHAQTRIEILDAAAPTCNLD